MGHYLSEMYPEGYDVAMRKENERRVKETIEREQRAALRRAAEITLMKISGTELSQLELKRRISAMLVRYARITSLIPASITLHIPDGEDNWDIFGNMSEEGIGKLTMERDPSREHETFELSINGEGARATHMERELYYMSWSSNNSERELKPAGELFDRLISPLEAKLGFSK